MDSLEKEIYKKEAALIQWNYYAPSVWNIAEASDFGSILSGKGGVVLWKNT